MDHSEMQGPRTARASSRGSAWQVELARKLLLMRGSEAIAMAAIDGDGSSHSIPATGSEPRSYYDRTSGIVRDVAPVGPGGCAALFWPKAVRLRVVLPVRVTAMPRAQ